MVSKNTISKIIEDELHFFKVITPVEFTEAIKMRGNGELTNIGLKKVLFGLYKERLNDILNGIRLHSNK